MPEPADDHETVAKARKDRVDALGEQAGEVRADIDALEAQLIVDRQVIAALLAEGIVDRDKITNLEVALVTARRIGAAIGILMARHGITDEKAFELLKLKSQSSHTKLRVIAEEVILIGALST